MGTKWVEIITDYAMPLIDDVRLQEELAESSALFFRKISIFLKNAVPLLDTPPELAMFLLGGLKYPDYDDYTWISDEESLSKETEIATGKIGFDICSVIRRDVDESGVVVYTPCEAKYDKETGNVVMPKQSEPGAEYGIDFYLDGEFSGDLTLSQKSLLGLAVAVIWDERFSRNWLNLQVKIKDQSFSPGSESTYINAVYNRLEKNRAELAARLHDYDMKVAYINTVPNGVGPKKLF